MPETDKKIKFVVVGCGHIGKRHSEMIKRNPEAELVALCDVVPEKSLDLKGIEAPYFESIDSLFSSGLDFDVVNICTANGLHAEHSMKSLMHKKHVVCEKPMALTTAECESIISVALRESRQIFCVMQNRFSPVSIWLKDIIDKRLLGDIHIVQITCYWNRDNKYYKPGSWKGTKNMDGGTLFTQFSHYIDLMYWLFGDIKDIQAKFHNFRHKETTEFEDSGIVNFNFLKQGMGSINYSTAVWDKNMESTITITGSKGSIKAGGQYMENIEYCHIEGYKMPELSIPETKYDYGDYKGAAANHHFIIENVIDTLKGRTSITTNALEGMKVVDIIQRIYSYRS